MTTKHCDVRKNLTRRRESVPVLKAIELLKWRGTWEQVRKEIPRADGSLFTYAAVSLAVRKHDLGLL